MADIDWTKYAMKSYGNKFGTKGFTTTDYMNSSGNNWFGISKKNNPFSRANIGGPKGMAAMAGITLGIRLGDTLLNKGVTNNTGNVLNTISGGLGAIPTPYTQAASMLFAGAGLVANGLTDRVNEGYQKAKNAEINTLANWTSAANDYEGLVADMNLFLDVDLGDLDSWGDIGFLSSGSKVKEARRKAQSALTAAKGMRIGNINARGQGINMMNTYNQLGHLTAFGGPLDGVDPSTAIGYSLYTDKFVKDKAKSDTGMTNMFAGTPSTMFNLGGVVQTKGANWGNLTHINAGESHEENPNDGVQIGTDYQGVPNLVEEGEVIYDDYVFSNRLIVPRGKRGNYGKRNKYAKGGKLNKEGESQMDYSSEVLKPFEGLTFAEAAKKAEKQSGANERPNDPIAQRGLKATLGVLAGVQEKEREIEKLLEMQEAIDQMTPEEFAMLQQQMEAQKAAEEQAALQQQQMIPQGMEQMVPQEQMAAAFGGPIYGLGGLLDNWDNTPVQQEPNIFEDGGFKEWWKKYINDSVINSYTEDYFDPDYGALYKAVTGEEGPTDSQEVYNALLKIYQQDRSKFKPYDFKTNTFIEENPTGETQILTTEEGSQTIPTVEGPLTEVLAHANLSAEDWSKLSEKQLDRYIKQYKSSLKKDDRVNFQERLDNFNQQLEYNTKVQQHIEAQRNSSIKSDDIKDTSFKNLERIARFVNPQYKNQDLSKMTYNERDDTIKKLREDIVQWSKDNNVGIGEVNDAFKAPTYHRDWKPVDAEEAWNETTTGYDWSKPLYGETSPVPVVGGNTKNRYQPRNWADAEGKVTIGDTTYNSMKDYELSDAYLKPRYELAKSAASTDDEGKKLWSAYTGSLSQNYTDSYVPEIVFGKDYASNLYKTDENGQKIDDYEGFKQYIINNYDSLNKPDANGNRSGFFDQIAGLMHGTYNPVVSRNRALYQMSNDVGHYLNPEGDWLNYYDVVKTEDDKKGTIKYTLAPKAGIHIDRADELPEGIAKNPDGSYKSTLDTKNDPFPKAPTWPYIAGIGLLGASALYNILTPADYSNADAMISAAKAAGTWTPISAKYAGQELPYKPAPDTLFGKLAGQTLKGARDIINNSRGNAGATVAGLIGNTYAGNIAYGDAHEKWRQGNWGMLKDVQTFGLQRDTSNYDRQLKADMSNQDAESRARGYTLEGQRAGYAMRQAIDDAKANAISAGISGIGSLLYNWADSDYKNKLIGWGIKHGAYAPQKVSKGGKVRRRKGLSF